MKSKRNCNECLNVDENFVMYILNLTDIFNFVTNILTHETN